MNRFLIEEETEFECYGVFKMIDEFATKSHHFHLMEKIAEESTRAILHILEADDYKSTKTFIPSVRINPFRRYMITRIGCERRACGVNKGLG